MTIREKFIVGFMVLTILYGAYELIGNRGTSNNETVTINNPLEELKGFTASVTKKLYDEKVSREYRYLISQAGNSWTKDPFIPSTTLLKKELPPPSAPTKAAVKRPKAAYVYTGFLQLGNTKLAVINGREYSVGEAIDTSGLYIKTISSKKVVLAKVNGLESIQVPISETDPSYKNQTP